MNYILYLKEKGKDKTFKACSLSNGLSTVGNLMYASLFKEEQIEKLSKAVESISKKDSNILFQIRTAKGKTIFKTSNN